MPEKGPKLDIPAEEPKMGDSGKTEKQILEELQAKAEKLAFVDVSKIAESEARDAAEAHLTEDREKTKGIGNFLKRVWKHNIMREYNRYKKMSEVREDIKSSDNIYAGSGKDREHHEAAMNAITERFLSEYEGVVRKDAGEEKKTLEGEFEKKAKKEAKQLVLDYAAGKFDGNEGAYKEARNRVLLQVTKGGKQGENVLGDAELYADNLKAIAEQVKQAHAHGVGLDKIEQTLDFSSITVGKAESGVRTEERVNKLERLTRKIHKTKLGALIGNETTIAAGVYGAGILASKTVEGVSRATGKAAGFFGGLAVAAGISAYKENRRMKEERAQHIRERAKGMNVDPEKDTPRREQMEKALYDMQSAEVLTDNLLSSIYVEGSAELGLKEFATQEELSRALTSIAEIESRINLNNKHRVDLIAYSGATNVESERARMEISLAKAKVDLRKKTEEDAKVKAFLQKDFNGTLEELTSIHESSLSKEELSAKDKAFGRIKAKEVIKAAGKGALSAAVIGTAIQEVSAFFSDRVDGLVETAIKGPSSEARATTALQGFREWISGQTGLSPEDIAKDAMFDSHTIGDHTLRLPEGTDLLKNPDGTYSIINDGSKIAEGVPIEFNPDGTISDATKEAFEKVGLVGAGHSVENIMEVKEVVADPKEFIEHHGGTTEVTRDMWYDNDTDAPVFDKNELRTWWGGENNTGIDSDGNYVFNVAQMTSEGSYHGDLSVDAQELVKDGQMKMLLSLSRETQNMVFELDVDANGNIIVDPDSEIGKIFFETQDGKAVFLGRFAEVAQKMGVDDSGVEHVRILSTVEGDGIEEIAYAQKIPGEEFVDDFVYDMNRPWEFPPAIPLIGRYPLEPMKDKKTPTPVPPGPTPTPTPVPGPEVRYEKIRNVYDLKQKYENYAFRLHKKGLKDIRYRARIIQAMAVILAEVDYLREKGLTEKTREQFLQSTKDGGALKGVGYMKMKTPEEYMDGFIKKAEKAYKKAKAEHRKNKTKANKKKMDEAKITLEEIEKTFDELIKSKDFESKAREVREAREAREKAEKEKEKRESGGGSGKTESGTETKTETKREPMEPISDKEWKKIDKTGIVSQERLADIVYKVKEKQNLDERESRVYDAIIGAIKGGSFFTPQIAFAKEVAALEDLEGKYEFYRTTSKEVNDGKTAIYKFREKKEKEEKPKKKEEKKTAKPKKAKAKSKAEEKTEVVPKNKAEVKTKSQEFNPEDVLSKSAKDITEDEWQVLGHMKRDFEKKIGAAGIKKLKEEVEKIEEMIKDEKSKNEPFDISKLGSFYTQMAYRKSESTNSSRANWRHLEIVRDGVKNFLEKKEK